MSDTNQCAADYRWPTRFIRRRWLVVAVAVLVTLLLMSSTHIRIGLKSAGFLVEILPDSPAYPSRWFSGEPTRTMIQFEHEDEFHGAFLYRPAERRCHAGIVLYIGLGPEHGDPHLDRISRAFARNGIAVLVPVSQAMVDYQLIETEHLVAASAFGYLRDRPETDPGRVGLFGISVGGAIVINAAQRPEINQEVAMVHSLGGYFDGFTLLADMAAGAYEVDGELIDWEPSSTTWRATRNSIVALMSGDDRRGLWDLFQDDVAEIPDGLSPEGEALARLLVSDDYGESRERAAELPDEIVQFLDGISPSRDLENLIAPTFLLHDKYDHVLPYSESVAFAEAASEHNPPRLTIIEQFHHVRPDVEGDRLGLLSDAWALYRHIFRMHQALDDRGWFTSPLDLVPFLGDGGECT